jgi:hypothetical protein
MSKIITPIATTVKLITQPKQGQYGGFQSILFIDDADREIWKSFPLDAAELEVLKPGMRVRLIPNGSSRGGKPSHVIELIDELPEMNKRERFNGQLSDDEKRAIARYIQQLAALYRYSYGLAAQHLEGMTQSEETLRCCADTLFKSAQQKFNL